MRAKEILRAIIKEAKRRERYYLISETFHPFHGNWEDELAEKMGANYEVWDKVYKLNERYRRFKHYIEEVKPAIV